MVKKIFAISILATVLPASVYSLEVTYDYYDFNRVYEDYSVFWSRDATYIITEETKKNFPEPVKETIKKPQIPPFIAIRFTPPEPQTSPSPREVKTYSNATYEKEIPGKAIVVYFPFNKAILTKDQKEKLTREVGEFLKKVKSESSSEKSPEVVASITGSACPIGSKNYNKRLSKLRTETVKKELLKMGIKVKKERGIGEVKESDVLCLNRKVIVNLEVR